MRQDRKEEHSFEEEVQAKFLDLYRRTKKEDRAKMFARAGIYTKDEKRPLGGITTKYYWMFDPITGETIDEALTSTVFSEKMMCLAEEALSISNCRGNIDATVLSTLTGVASVSEDKFTSMVLRWECKQAVNLKVVEFRDPPVSFGDRLKGSLNLLVGHSTLNN